MRKKASSIFVVDMGMYPQKLFFSAGYTYDEINKELTKQKCWDWKLGISQSEKLLTSGTNFALKRTIEKKGVPNRELYYIILIEPFRFTDYDFCKLAHEILHICQFFLPGVCDREKEIEAEAYLHTYLMENIIQKLRHGK